jgi:hypothetical protein
VTASKDTPETIKVRKNSVIFKKAICGSVDSQGCKPDFKGLGVRVGVEECREIL